MVSVLDPPDTEKGHGHRHRARDRRDRQRDQQRHQHQRAGWIETDIAAGDAAAQIPEITRRGPKPDADHAKARIAASPKTPDQTERKKAEYGITDDAVKSVIDGRREPRGQNASRERPVPEPQREVPDRDCPRGGSIRGGPVGPPASVRHRFFDQARTTLRRSIAQTLRAVYFAIVCFRLRSS